MDKIYFVTELVRYNDRDNHTYIIGVYDDELLALKDGWECMKGRAGKYGAEVTGYKLNTGEKVYERKLDCWDAFANSCKDIAVKIRKMMDEEE